MRSLCFKIACFIILPMLMLAFVSNGGATGAGMKTVATDVIYGGAAGALVGTGVSLLQEGPDWTKNLRRGTGIGLILGLGFGIYDGFVLGATHRNHRALFNVESRGVSWSVPQLVMTTEMSLAYKGSELFGFRFDALRYRF